MYYCDSFRFFALFTVYFFGKGSDPAQQCQQIDGSRDQKYGVIAEILGDISPQHTACGGAHIVEHVIGDGGNALVGGVSGIQSQGDKVGLYDADGYP